MIKPGKKTFLVIGIILFAILDVFSVVRADDISSLQSAIDKIEKKKAEAEQQLEASQSLLQQNKIQVGATQSKIAKAEDEITRKEEELKSLDAQVDLFKKMLAAYLQQLYFDNQDPVMRLATADGDLRSILGDSDQTLSIKEKILGLLNEINASQQAASQAKEELAEKKEEHEQLLAQQKAEQGEILSDIQDAQTTLNQLNSKLSALRSEYSKILGKSVSTDDILEAAKFAAKVTGMNKSFLLGVLIQESNKGQSVGGCDYKSSRMTSTQLTAFKSICSELDYNYKKQPVSCPSSAYKGTGGAMGIPQFMPTTWQGYKKTIASLSGHNPPDPWNLVDGVVAMASKLSNDGASQKTRFAEAKSYCVYLAGGNWGYYCYGTDKYKKSYEDVNCWGSSIHNYGEKVLCLKDNYEKYY